MSAMTNATRAVRRPADIEVWSGASVMSREPCCKRRLGVHRTPSFNCERAAPKGQLKGQKAPAPGDTIAAARYATREHNSTARVPVQRDVAV